MPYISGILGMRPFERSLPLSRRASLPPGVTLGSNGPTQGGSMKDRKLSRRSGFVEMCLLGGLMVGAVGCDGSGSSGQGGNGNGTDAGSRDGGSIFKTDTRVGVTDARIMRSEPVISDMLKKLPITGRVALVGTGISSCTNEKPAPGDRWCAISRSAELGREELFVINISAVSKGIGVQCTGADPNCVRLTQNLWTGTPSVGPTHPYAHAFDGDTLIYHADATSAPTDLYQGPIWAWRPGWPAARQISSKKGITCVATLQGQAALCLDNIEPDDTKPLEFDLLAGPLPATAGTQLPRIDRIHPSHANDVSKWRASFSRDGSIFCYSTGRAPTDSENLWCFPSATLPASAVANGPRTTAPFATGASKWAISRDNQKVYYLKTFNYNADGSPDGVLTMVDYPGGQNAVALSPKVGAFILLSDGTATDKGLGVFADVKQNRGTFRFITDRTVPANYVTIAKDIASASVSQDLRYTFLTKMVNEQTGLSDAHVARNFMATKDADAPFCTLQNKSTTDLYGSPFLDKAGLVFWVDDVDPNVFVGKGWVANPEDCGNKRQYAKDVDFWFTVNDEGLIYSDDTDIDVVSIRYASIPDGKTFPTGGAGLPLQKQAGRIYSMAIPKYDVLVIQIDQGYASDGIYYAKLPFGGPPADAGVADASIDAL